MIFARSEIDDPSTSVSYHGAEHYNVDGVVISNN